MSLCTQTIAHSSQVLYFWLCHSGPKPHSFVYAEIIKISSHYCVDLGKDINYISYVSITLKLGKHCPMDRLVFTVWPGDLRQVKIILGCFSV